MLPWFKKARIRLAETHQATWCGGVHDAVLMRPMRDDAWCSPPNAFFWGFYMLGFICLGFNWWPKAMVSKKPQFFYLYPRSKHKIKVDLSTQSKHKIEASLLELLPSTDRSLQNRTSAFCHFEICFILLPIYCCFMFYFISLTFLPIYFCSLYVLLFRFTNFLRF